MALRISTGVRQGMLGTQGLKEMFNGGKIDIYSGAQPAAADYAETGSLLVSITSSSGTGGLDWGTAVNGVITKGSGVWSGLIGTSGIAGWFRVRASGGVAGSSTTEMRIDGNIGVSGSDMALANTSLTAAATLTIDSFSITAPAQ